MAKTTDTAMWPHPLVVCGRLFSRLLVLDRLTYIYIFSFYMNTCNLVWEPPITAAIISELRFTAASTHFKQIMPPNDIGSREQTRACLSVGNYDGCHCHPQFPLFCQTDATVGQSLSQLDFPPLGGPSSSSRWVFPLPPPQFATMNKTKRNRFALKCLSTC